MLPGGAEIDLMLELPGSPRTRFAIEIKRSPAAGVKRGFHEACADIRPTHKFVIHALPDAAFLEHLDGCASRQGILSGASNRLRLPKR